MLYPLVSSTWNQMLANRTIGSYNDKVADMPEESLKAVLQAALDYNDRMKPHSVPDAFTVRENLKDPEYEALLNISGDGMMGYIEIPVIKVKSPIYHYTTEEVLQKGVGHLFGSSLPVGGKGTHSVLSAHRGLPNNKLFSDLDKVAKGDRFYITICNETFAYEIDQIETVEPDQTQGLRLFEGEDYVTLITCTPYGVNTHRLLVRGYRVPYEPGEEDETKARVWFDMNIMISLAGILLALLILGILLIRRLKRRKS